jgi:hypothetical protein
VLEENLSGEVWEVEKRVLLDRAGKITVVM